MKIGTVIGNVWSTKKDSRLNGQKLLLVEIEGNVEVASDIIGAGVDDMVLLVSGSAARISAGSNETPVDLAVIGIVDSVQDDK